MKYSKALNFGFLSKLYSIIYSEFDLRIGLNWMNYQQISYFSLTEEIISSNKFKISVHALNCLSSVDAFDLSDQIVKMKNIDSQFARNENNTIYIKNSEATININSNVLILYKLSIYKLFSPFVFIFLLTMCHLCRLSRH